MRHRRIEAEEEERIRKELEGKGKRAGDRIEEEGRREGMRKEEEGKSKGAGDRKRGGREEE